VYRSVVGYAEIDEEDLYYEVGEFEGEDEKLEGRRH
jgi:protoheme IX farnesyltransferase